MWQYSGYTRAERDSELLLGKQPCNLRLPQMWRMRRWYKYRRYNFDFQLENKLAWILSLRIMFNIPDPWTPFIFQCTFEPIKLAGPILYFCRSISAPKKGEEFAEWNVCDACSSFFVPLPINSQSVRIRADQVLGLGLGLGLFSSGCHTVPPLVKSYDTYRILLLLWTDQNSVGAQKKFECNIMSRFWYDMTQD